MNTSELLDIEATLLNLADDISDRDQYYDNADNVERLRDLARRIAVQAETSRLKAV
jgi:hypothetical protein